MRCRSRPAPAAPRGVAGAPLLWILLLINLSSCRADEPAEPRILVLGTDTIVLPDTVGLVTFDVGRGEEGTNRFEPATAQAAPGDIVRFNSLDNGAHAIAFDAATLTPDAHAYLEASGQLRSPPLLERDAAWIVNLQDAPPGTYGFSCATHGERGTLTVEAR